MLSDLHKKQIIWNYAFNLFEDEIHNMNKTRYSDFHTYVEAKSEFILSEKRKASKTNKISETNNSKDNSYGVANTRNIKNKEFKQKKRDHEINRNSSSNENSSLNCN